MSTIHARTCHICEANCGVLVEVEGRAILSIKGNPDHVLSRGHICPKATAIADLQDDPDRLHKPVKKVNGEWQEIGWQQAFSEIAARLLDLKGQGAKPAMYMASRISILPRPSTRSRIMSCNIICMVMSASPQCRISTAVNIC